MLPKHHIVYAILFGLFLFIIFPSMGYTGLLLLIFSAIFIDTDHYIFYVYKTRNPNLKKAYQWFVKKNEKWEKMNQEQKDNFWKKYKVPILLFHGIEALAIALILSFFYKPFFWMLIGMVVHLTWDYEELISLGSNPLSKISQIYVYFYNRGKKDLLKKN